MQAVRLHPRHQGTLIEVHSNGQSLAWFDPRKLERALYNLLLNACEAAPGSDGRVQVTVDRTGSSVTIAVSDNGPGIAEPIRDKLFHPFVSFGKENGTGLGLTVVQKIIQDHGGQVLLERTSDARTVFRITIPGRAPQGSLDAGDDELTPGPFLPVTNDRATENSIRHSDT
jgi:signal transduction histidine kinase